MPTQPYRLDKRAIKTMEWAIFKAEDKGLAQSDWILLATNDEVHGALIEPVRLASGVYSGVIWGMSD